MIKKSKSVNEILYYCYFLLFVLSSILPSIFSAYSLLTESAILMFLLIINIKSILKDSRNLTLTILTLLISIISLIFTDGGIGSILNLFHFLGGMIIFSNLELNYKMQNFVYAICGILWIYNIRLSFSAWNLYITGNNIYNPNSVGIFIFLTTIVIKSFLDKHNGKIIIIPLFIASAYCIFLTNCRTALVAFVAYILVSYIPILNKFVLKHNRLIIYLIIIFGTIFPVIYVNMYIHGTDLKIPYIGKKLFTGREKLWYYILDAIKNEDKAFIFGLGTNYQTNIGVIENVHNWYIGVLYTFGFPILCSYFKILINIISRLQKKEIIYALIAILIIGFTETVGLWITTQTYIFMCLIIDRNLKREDIENDNNIHTNI